MFLKRKRNLMMDMDMDMDMNMKSMVKVAFAGVIIYQATKFLVNKLTD